MRPGGLFTSRSTRRSTALARTRGQGLDGLVRECALPEDDPWLREPHGYMLKPDFKRPEQRRDASRRAARKSPFLPIERLRAFESSARRGKR